MKIIDKWQDIQQNNRRVETLCKWSTGKYADPSIGEYHNATDIIFRHEDRVFNGLMQVILMVFSMKSAFIGVP